MTSQVIKKDENDEVSSALEAKLAAGIEALQSRHSAYAYIFGHLDC